MLSFVASVMAIYFASVIEKATMDYKVERRHTGA